MPNLDPTTPDELPEPSSESVLYGVLLEALLASLPRAEALSMLRRMAERLASEECLSAVWVLRPGSEQSAVNRARRQAIAAFRRFLPVWLASIDAE